MRTAVLSSLGKYSDLGLLALRLGVGVMFVFHGFPKVVGGPERWEQLGGAMTYLGVGVYPVVWGFLAAFSELVGGLCLILGVFSRVAALLLFATMVVAASFHLGRGDGLQTASHAITLAFVFFGLIFVGPGRHSVDGR